MSDRPRLRICLIAPPITEPSVPNLAIELLAGLARAQGHHVHTVHAALRQRRTFRSALIHGMPAPATFGPLFHGVDAAPYVDGVAAAAMADFAEDEELDPSFGEHLADDLLFAANDARRCVDEVVADVGGSPWDVVGFSLGFDAQKIPGAAIARALRGAGQVGVFVAGGTGCDGPMGEALLEWCPEFDVVLQGECETSWPQLLDRIGTEPAAARTELSLETVPGAVWRHADDVRVTPETPFDASFLTVPEPDYTDFLAQRDASPYATARSFILFETSRGCWWGERRQCTFCGIRNVAGPYRVRAADQSVALVRRLQERYHPDVLYATDSIADRDFEDDVWPALARERRDGADWTLFYETKSDLTRRRTALLAAAGVAHVQPGIESLSSAVLRSMHKGATSLQQVAMLKWAATYGLELHYSLMTGLPGESAEDIAAMIEVIEAVPHLPPPAGLNRLALHRFSPHFDDPAGYGLGRVRPFATQRAMYRADDELLLRLCYQLDYDLRGERGLHAERRALKDAIARWKQRHDAGTSLVFDVAGPVRIVRSQAGGAGAERTFVVHDPVEVHVFDAAQEVVRLDTLRRNAPSHPAAVDAAVRRLQAAGVVLVDGARAVVLAVPAAADAWIDAGLDQPAPERRTA